MTTVQKKRGATWLFGALIADNSGVAITDFTGWKIWMTIKAQSTDTDEDAIAQVSLEDGGIVVVDAESGEVEVTFAATETINFAIKKYIADLKVKSDTGLTDYTTTITIDCVVNITGAV